MRSGHQFAAIYCPTYYELIDGNYIKLGDLTAGVSPVTGYYVPKMQEYRVVGVKDNAFAQQTKIYTVTFESEEYVYQQVEGENPRAESGVTYYRRSGDEFLIVGPECNVDEAERVREAILKFLDGKNNDGSQPYRISVSTGYVITKPDSQESLQDYVQEADRLMYEIKKKVHEADGDAGR